MNHLLIAPIVLPAMLAPLIGFVMRHDISLARAASFVGSIALLAIALMLFGQAQGGEIDVYRLGAWDAPFGIVLVLDRLSALLVLITTVLALIVLLHAVATGWDAKGRHFHALFQFQLMGIIGAFLTGDIFNLFVFFEILLIASYGLMIHGGGRERMRAGVQYVVFNLAGSTLFLFALGTLYGAVGTLNMADLAAKVAEMPVEEAALLRVAAMLLMIVFAVKAALFPVQFWLPGAYANAPAPVAALFAIMTKVGAYAIIRVHTLIFGPDMAATAGVADAWLFPAAIVTILVGAIGVLGAKRLLPLIAFSVVGSMGALLVAISAFTPEALMAALYYLVHSTFAAAALFMIADLVMARRGSGRLTTLPPTQQNGLFAALFFGAAIAMAGMPPLSGFLGKLMVMDALRAPGQMGWAWSAILIGSLVTVVGFARAGSVIFWKSTSVDTDLSDPETEALTPPNATALELAPSFAALAVLGLVTALAGPLTNQLEATAAQVYDRAAYVDTVLAPWDEAKGGKDTHAADHGADHGTEHGADHSDEHSAPHGDTMSEEAH